MSENTNSPVNFTESPASWNTRYITPQGFECQLTLRAQNGQELLEKASGAITYLLKHDCQPFISLKGKTRSNGNNNGSKANSTESEKLCPIHQVPLRRFEKEGRVWYAHKTDEGWCNGSSSK